MLTVDTDKKELEETARILDKAILEQDPNVTVQTSGFTKLLTSKSKAS